MKILENSKKTVLLTAAVFTGAMAFSMSPEVVEETVIHTPIYEKLGISSTTLFIVMNIFTFLLVAFMMSMANSTKNILKYKQDEKRKGNSAKTLLMLVGLFVAAGANAAEPVTQAKSLIPFPDSVFWAYIFVDVILIMIMIYFAGIIKGSISDIIVFRKTLIWKKWGKNLTDAVPVEEEGSILLDHDYDGIKELDNNLPPWWKYGFYITIVWAFGYFFYYQVFEIGNLQEAEYLAEMEEGERQVAEYKAAHPELITADNVELLTDPSAIAEGRDVFTTYCVSCHMEGGAGGIGPNLTDEYWLYGNDIKGVFTTVSEGAENGMTAWKNLLPADKIQAVSSYVLQLEYIAPPQGKDPQGDKK